MSPSFQFGAKNSSPATGMETRHGKKHCYLEQNMLFLV